MLNLDDDGCSGERNHEEASEVRKTAYSLPLTSPAHPKGPYRFVNREFLVITYRTGPEQVRTVVPELLQIDQPLIKFEFIRMPDSTGFAGCTESGRVIPGEVRQRGWRLLPYTSTTDRRSSTVLKALAAQNFLLKIIPHVDGSPRIYELVRYELQDVR